MRPSWPPSRPPRKRAWRPARPQLRPPLRPRHSRACAPSSRASRLAGMPSSSSFATARTSASSDRCAHAAAAASPTAWRWSRSSGWPSRPPSAMSSRVSCWTPTMPAPWPTLRLCWCCATTATVENAAIAAPTGRDRAAARLEEAVFAAGGGWLAAALRLDPEGHAARLLARCAWVPDLEAALAIRAHLPVGWRLVTRAGVVVDDLAVIRPAPGVSTLERRAALDEVTRQLARVSAELERGRGHGIRSRHRRQRHGGPGVGRARRPGRSPPGTAHGRRS